HGARLLVRYQDTTRRIDCPTPGVRRLLRHGCRLCHSDISSRSGSELFAFARSGSASRSGDRWKLDLKARKGIGRIVPLLDRLTERDAEPSTIRRWPLTSSPPDACIAARQCYARDELDQTSSRWHGHRTTRRRYGQARGNSPNLGWP